MNINKSSIIFTEDKLVIILLLTASYLAIFLHIDTYPLYLWDEATYAVNAIEMHYNNDFLVKYFAGQPEMWATNPPLVCWLQVLCIKLVGENELAIRLPSGLATLGVVLLIIRYGYKEKIGLSFIIFAVMIILTSNGYNGYHVVRNGDLDAPVIFFITGSIIYFFKYLEYEKEKTKYLIIFSCFLLLGYFTKGIAAYLIAPAFLIYAIIRKKLKYIFFDIKTYLSIAIILIIICSYYYARELKNPGYILQAWHNEIAGRFTETNEGHKGPINYYLTQLWETDYTYYLFFILIALFSFTFFYKNELLRKHGLLWFISCLAFLLVISLSETKTEWYDGPLYPMMAIFIALNFNLIFEKLESRFYTLKYLSLIKYTVIISLFVFPFSEIINRNLKQYQHNFDMDFGFALKRYDKLPNHKNQIELLITNFPNHALFYMQVYNHKNYEITYKDVSQKIEVSTNKNYLFSHPKIKEHVDSNYIYETLWQDRDIYIINVKANKTP